MGQITFNRSAGFSDLPLTLPCGQCVGCRLERSRQWAIRCTHEASLHADNCFITLTYNDDHLPEDKSLNVEHFQRFMKRLRSYDVRTRKKQAKEQGIPYVPRRIKFYHCGEYGDNFGRPHFHACLFNFDFPDRRIWRTTGKDNETILYRSETLERLWSDPETGESFGYSSIGEVTFESAAYVARYVLKKVTGHKALNWHVDPQTLEWTPPHYMDLETGVIRTPEYTTMSRGGNVKGQGGIGKDWIDKYASDVYPHDFFYLRGKKMRPPKFYDAQFELLSPDEFAKIRSRRKRGAKDHADNNTPERLKTREIVQQARLDQLPRKLT